MILVKLKMLWLSNILGMTYNLERREYNRTWPNRSERFSPTHVSDWVTGPLSLFGPHTNLGPGHLFSPSLAVSSMLVIGEGFCAQRWWRVEPSPARSPPLATRPRYACIAWCWVCVVSPCTGRRLESFMSVLPSWLGASRFQSGSIV